MPGAIAALQTHRNVAFLIAAFLMILVGDASYFVYEQVQSGYGAVAIPWSGIRGGDITSGRMIIYRGAWSHFTSAEWLEKIFGSGVGSGASIARQATGIYMPLHNDLLGMLIGGGVLGLGLYLWDFAGLYRDCFRGLRKNLAWAAAGIAGLVAYWICSMTYLQVFAVTPNTYFGIISGTSLGSSLRVGKRKQ